jgi:hypothetical protein
MKQLLRRILKEQEEEQYYKISPQDYLELMKLSGYHGSVTKLKKFGGKPFWITGPLDISNTPTDTLGNVARIDGRLDISNTNIGDISGIQVKGHIWDTKTPREKKRIAAEIKKKKEESQLRREEGEWDLKTADDEGLKAHALFEWLVNQGEIEVMTDEEKEEYNSLKSKLKDLTEIYNSEELEPEEVSPLQDEISDIETRIEELEETMNDVYVISPYKYKHYGLNTFEVIGIPGLMNQEYTVGTEDEMEEGALEYAKNYIDEVGIEGFRDSFLEDNIDTDALESYVRDSYEYDIRDNPESYFNDEDFQLTDEQEKRIEELENYIQELEDYIQTMEEEQNELENEIEDPDEYSKRHDEIQKMIDDAETKRDDAQEELDSIEPDTEPTEDMIEEKLQEKIDEAMTNPMRYMKDYGLELKEYIDEDSLAEELVRSDGWGIMNSYDGTYDSESIEGEYYYIMRIN